MVSAPCAEGFDGQIFFRARVDAPPMFIPPIPPTNIRSTKIANGDHPTMKDKRVEPARCSVSAVLMSKFQSANSTLLCLEYLNFRAFSASVQLTRATTNNEKHLAVARAPFGPSKGITALASSFSQTRPSAFFSSTPISQSFNRPMPLASGDVVLLCREDASAAGIHRVTTHLRLCCSSAFGEGG